MTTVPYSERPYQAGATLELLWERVRRRGDMPGFTKAITAILGAMRGEDEREFSMTQTVLSDPVLTQKVLRLANSGMYAAFGQRVNTVSKAVMVLGTEAIGHLALGLKLVEELKNSTPDDLGAQVEMEKAVLAGMVAQQVAGGLRNVDAEEAVVCSILHTLGRMMVTFYLPEHWQQLRVTGGDGGAQAAAPALLGLSLEDIGRATAEHWGLPKNLVAGMRTIEPGTQDELASHGDWLAALSTMAAQCADALWNDDEAGAARVEQLAAGFAPLLDIDGSRILEAVERARVNAAAELTVAPLSKPLEKQERILAATRQRAAGAQLLVEGVADMREAASTLNPGQMVSMALETVQQGLVFSRAFAFLYNRRERRYIARLGIGTDAKAILPKLAFDDSGAPDVFHAALNSDRVIFIENAHEPKFMSKLPNWWLANLADARCFVILPLCRHGQPAGFIYGEWSADMPPVQLSQAEFALLNDLRGIVVRNLERPVVDSAATIKA
ncbi:HDOD domain-containing protein [Massilia sp. S19_KUP03_FR1]|uniref:HDOD domain-containing protein n=1 Tax=Massilia sp. S19_KUP03_FR1 TaxID=3025503 RepID=UPI002FCDC5FF